MSGSKYARNPGGITPSGKYRGPSPVITPKYDRGELAPFLRDPKLLPMKPPSKKEEET
jgi:hypothetical protein